MHESYGIELGDIDYNLTAERMVRVTKKVDQACSRALLQCGLDDFVFSSSEFSVVASLEACQ